MVIRIRTKRGGRLPSGSVVSDYEEFPPESSFGGSGFFYMPKSREIAEENSKPCRRDQKKSLHSKLMVMVATIVKAANKG